MSARTLLYGLDGRPIAVDHGTTDEQRDLVQKALLLECFGALNGIQQKFEWPTLAGGMEQGARELLDAIVEMVGREAIVVRYRAYGVRFSEEGPPADAPAADPLPPADAHCGHCAGLYACDDDGPCGEHDGPPATPGHTDASRPFKAIKGGKS